MATVWMTVTVLKSRRLYKSTNLHIIVCGILIERDCFKMFELLRIWSISQFLAAPFSHCKAMIDNIISSDMHFCPWPLLPLSCWPWSFSGCSSIVRIWNFCVVLCLYAYQLKGHEMHLWAISENWFVIGWSIFSSLVRVKIHLHNSWQIYKKSNRAV